VPRYKNSALPVIPGSINWADIEFIVLDSPVTDMRFGTRRSLLQNEIPANHPFLSLEMTIKCNDTEHLQEMRKHLTDIDLLLKSDSYYWNKNGSSGYLVAVSCAVSYVTFIGY
jgi:hypothetical protein